MSKSEETSLYKLCQQALDMTLAQGTTMSGFSIDRVYENLLTITSYDEWSKQYLFCRTAKTLIAIAANQCGKRAGVKRMGVYFDENSMNQIIAEGLLINAELLAGSHEAKANDLAIKVSKCTTDGQLAFDDKANIHQEMSLKRLSEIIKDKELSGG